MTHITIPPEAVEAAENAYCAAWDADEPAILAACLAMLNAWPGAAIQGPRPHFRRGPQIILPLPKEPEA